MNGDDIMKRQRIVKFIIDFLIIAISFEISEYVAIKVFHSEKWYVELIIYMVVFMLLQGLVSLVERMWNMRDIEKVKNSKKAKR